MTLPAKAKRIVGLAFHPWRIAWFRALFAVLVVLGLSCSASSVRAQTVQPGFAVNRFSPSERGSDWFVLESLDFRGMVRPAIGLVGDYSYKPLVAYDQNGNEVDAVIRKYLSIQNLAIAIVSDKGAEVRQKLIDGVATPITYDTGGTPAAILEEDKIIEKFPVPVAKDKVRVVPVDQMFER